MGFKFVPFQKPRECWAEPGHIYLKDNGRIIDCASSIKESLPVQTNQFTSETAMWVLYSYDRSRMFVGNNYGQYMEIRLSDGVMLSCGSWNKPYHEWETCGVYMDLSVVIDVTDKRTIVFPAGGETFVLHHPIQWWDADQAVIQASMSVPSVPIVWCERGLVNFERDGTWVSTPTARGPDAPLQL